WQFQYFRRDHLQTVTGEPLAILHPGTINRNQGPDFLQARIRIGPTQWVGSVELHLHTSEWDRHGHEGDPHYANVVLHVVYRHDGHNGNGLPLLELEPRISYHLLARYRSLMEGAVFIPCAASLPTVTALTWQAWKERLLMERLTRKSDTVLQRLKGCGNHWEEAFWQTLAAGFGLKVNSEVFEAAARTLPYAQISRHRHSIHQLEALLLGQCGLLAGVYSDEYFRLLQREYGFLRKKYTLHPVPQPVRFLRMRPIHFPTVRLAQLAMLLHTTTGLFSRLIEEPALDALTAPYRVTANDYWHYRYRPDEPSAYRPKTTGGEWIRSLVINTLAPALFAYGRYHRNPALQERAMDWMQETAPESHSIIRGFTLLGISAESAFDTQALTELKNEYCTLRRCLECAVGNYLLKSGAETVRPRCPS
ncbi:MAG TPA: DUF2851 family protein, partial [Chitinophagaceae bacterium]|nr:DUF2851 family protein [Chitinophagaceae bacterium]